MEPNESVRKPEMAPKLSGLDRDPLELARRLADEYTSLSQEIEAPGGTQERRNRHLQGSYWLGFFYYQSPESYLVFAADVYFRDLRQKPNEKNIMRSALKFTMRAKKNKLLLNRVYKRAAVLENFYAEGVVPDDVAALLKKRGGIDYVYDQLRAAKKLRREDLIEEDESDDEGDAALAEADADEDAEQPALADGGGDDLPAGDEASRETPAIARAQNDPPNDGKGEAEPPDPPKQGRLDVIDLEKDVAIEMEQPHQVELVLNATGGLIRFKRWPPDKRGWRRITGHIESLDRDEDQSLDKPNDDVA